MDDLVASVRRSLADDTREVFDRRVERQARAMRGDVTDGALDNPDFAMGIEIEAYVVDGEGRLAPAPATVFDLEGADPELGLHNVEVHTPPDVFDAAGVDRQADTLERRVEQVRRRVGEAGGDLVLDGMWTIPPPGGTEAYLGDVTEHEDVVVAENMRRSDRYVAIDNEVLRRAGGVIEFSVPGFQGTFPSILLESLTSSVQPHLQVPDAEDFPAYFNAALRTTGPVLALTSNSPFLPVDLYGLDGGSTTADGLAPLDLVEETPHELRVPAFEQSINAGAADELAKVRFPRDLESTGDVVDRLVADPTYAPFLSDADWAEGTYDERYPELAHKRGTYWRWVRAVVGGQRPRGSEGTEASVRIEYRPIPAQPTPTDVVSCQALVCGLVRGLVAAEHPVVDLPWSAARDSFYAAVADGLAADLAWVTADGEPTSDPEDVFGEVFAYARRGLANSGLARERVEDVLRPVEDRWELRATPSTWKKEQVRANIEAGQPFGEAVSSMQRRYIELAGEHESFVRWVR